jgi:hypothetical protein
VLRGVPHRFQDIVDEPLLLLLYLLLHRRRLLKRVHGSDRPNRTLRRRLHNAQPRLLLSVPPHPHPPNVTLYCAYYPRYPRRPPGSPVPVPPLLLLLLLKLLLPLLHPLHLLLHLLLLLHPLLHRGWLLKRRLRRGR